MSSKWSGEWNPLTGDDDRGRSSEGAKKGEGERAPGCVTLQEAIQSRGHPAGAR